jgi:uncharacterized membrane protein
VDNRRPRRFGPVAAALAFGLLVALLVFTYYFGFWRSVVGLAIPAVVVYLGFSYFKAAGQSPPEAEVVIPKDVDEIRFRCRMCGLVLLVEEAGSDRPPTHCREKMEVVLTARPHPLD